MLALLIDDGVATRGHRLNCMNPNFNEVGAALAPHGSYQWVCVIDFATEVVELSQVRREDCVVTAKSLLIEPMSEEFKLVTRSIPVQNIIEEVDKLLQVRENIVTIDFRPSSDSATIICKNGSSTRQMNIAWGY